MSFLGFHLLFFQCIMLFAEPSEHLFWRYVKNRVIYFVKNSTYTTFV